MLTHDVPENVPASQAAWRFCSRCFGMYFDGFPEKGHCPAGDMHEAAGFNFVLDATEHKAGPIDDN